MQLFLFFHAELHRPSKRCVSEKASGCVDARWGDPGDEWRPHHQMLRPRHFACCATWPCGIAGRRFSRVHDVRGRAIARKPKPISHGEKASAGGAYRVPYCGPPPPSGAIHTMFCVGSLMSQVLQCTQLAALICRRLPVPLPASASATIS